MAAPKKPGNPQHRPSESKELKQDDLVEMLVPDPARPPEVRVLVGFVGKSARPGYWRLYLTPELDDYVEVRDEDVVHTRTLTSEQSILGGTVVWTKRDAEIQRTRTVPQQAQAEFLRGDVAAAFAARTRGAASLAARRFGGIFTGGLANTFSVTACITCPTDGGEHTCVPATCTLATSCLTTFPCPA